MKGERERGIEGERCVGITWMREGEKGKPGANPGGQKEQC